MGRLFGGFYASWCVRSMTKDAARHFSGDYTTATDRGLAVGTIGM